VSSLFLHVLGGVAGSSISLTDEHEAAGEDKRGSEAGGGADSGIAPVKPAVLDPDDERLRIASGLG
jgi:hypothetical protein